MPSRETCTHGRSRAAGCPRRWSAEIVVELIVGRRSVTDWVVAAQMPTAAFGSSDRSAHATGDGRDVELQDDRLSVVVGEGVDSDATVLAGDRGELRQVPERTEVDEERIVCRPRPYRRREGRGVAGPMVSSQLWRRRRSDVVRRGEDIVPRRRLTSSAAVRKIVATAGVDVVGLDDVEVRVGR